MSLWLRSLLGLWLTVAALDSMAAEPRRLRVLTSIAPLYSWAANVAGDRADVQNLLPADVGPHDFQFRPRDLRKIREADVIFLNGLGLEAWFAKVVQANDPSAHKKIVEAAAGIPTNSLIYELPTLATGEGGDAHHDHEHAHEGAANPHIWLDPVFAQIAVSNLAAVLIRADPTNASAYAANAEAYQAKLRDLDQALRSGLAKAARRDVITFHDAFPYFCQRYDLKLVGVVEEVPGSSPSPRYLAALSQVVRDRKIGALFVEPQFDPRLARRLATDLSIGVATLDTLETGRLDASAYEEGMRANLRALQQVLK